jgi:hypothetical protein
VIGKVAAVLAGVLDQGRAVIVDPGAIWWRAGA